MTIDLNEPLPDTNELANEFMALKAKCERAALLEREQKTRSLTKEEEAFLADMPAVYRRAVEVTRILRRTNTGPARVKTKTTKAAKKAQEQDKINQLLNF